MAYVAGGGEFNRDTNYITTRITADGRDGYPVEPGRYRLIVARACPWANRAIIVRRLLGLEDVLSIGFCGPTHDERSWTFDLDPGGVDPVLQDPAAAGRVLRPRSRTTRRASRCPRSSTCRPARWSPTTSPQITLDLSTEWTRRTTATARRSCTPSRCATRSTRSPSASTPRSTTASTAAASPARRRPTTRPTTGCSPRWTGSSERLADQRYLVGDTITEADVRLFTTLARFDPVYHGHFKCNRNKLAEMPVLWAYARDLFQTPGFGDTIDFVQIKQHYYIVHTDINPTRIVPKGPDLSDWLTPHGREALGGRPFGDGTPPGPTREGERVPAGHSRRLGPDGAHRPLGVRQRELVALLVADQGRQLHRDAGEPAAARVDGRNGDRQLRVRPELLDDVSSGPRRPAAAPTAPRAMAGGTDSCTGLRALTASSPWFSGSRSR